MSQTFESIPYTDKAFQQAQSPAQVIQILKDGNARFVGNKNLNKDAHAQVKATGGGQFPLAAVLGCIDSRVPAEQIFDLGIGDIFNARVAGNFANTDILGSLEFACKVAGSKAILVLGHTSCGAVKGACDAVKLGNLTSMLENIQPAVDAVTDITDNRNSSNAEFVQKVADANVEQTIAFIRNNSEVLKDMEDKGEITIQGAMYDVASGEVKFFA